MGILGSRKLKLGFFLYFLFLAVILSFCISNLSSAINTFYAAKNAKSAILQAQDFIKKQQISEASRALSFAMTNLNGAQISFKKLSWLEIFPYLRIQYRAGNHLLSAVAKTTSSLFTTLDTADVILGSLHFGKIKDVSSINKKQKKLLLQNLYQSAPILSRAKSQLGLAELEINKIPKYGVLPPIKKYQNEFTQQFSEIKKAQNAIVLASRLLPGLAGYPQEQTYFIMFQNNRELRPAGGFFGTYGILKLKDGEIKNLKTDDPYNLDNKAKISVTPPWQIPTLVNPDTKSWYLRDSNWSPDFPTSAEKALWFYQEEGGKEKDFVGVIGFTPTVLEYLIELTGPIKIEGFPLEFTSENVVSLIQYQTGQRFAELGIKEEFRKEIIGEVAKILLKRILALPKEAWPALFSVLQKSLLEKHIFLYFKESEIQEFIDEQNWAGKIQDAKNDYLFIVDSNCASLKTDEYIKRFFNYEIDLTQKEAQVKLSLTYKNESSGFSWKTTRYRNWNRIYVPKDSQLLQVSGQEQDLKYYGPNETPYEITKEHNKTVFGSFVIIEPGDEKTLTYQYKLPENLSKSLKNNYQLYFQKQGGLIKPGFKITVITDKKIKSFLPDFGQKIDDKKIEFSGELNQDRQITIDF
ncbi:MAG: DUF4012 domain-containing protein [Patescibacteria group bacterium]